MLTIHQCHHPLIIAIEGYGRRTEHDDMSLFVIVGSADMVRDERHGGYGPPIAGVVKRESERGRNESGI